MRRVKHQIQVMEDDKRSRCGVFHTGQKGTVPPLVTTDFVVEDQGILMAVCKYDFLGRLLRVDLIKWVSNIRPYVRPSTESFFDFNEIFYVGEGRRVMHDGMHGMTRSKVKFKVTSLESRKFSHFQRLSSPHL